jgi:hypothetical protein
MAEEEGATPTGATCSICLVEDIQLANLAQTASCRHSYCYACIMTWMERGGRQSCPMCKRYIGGLHYAFRTAPLQGHFRPVKLLTPVQKRILSTAGIAPRDSVAVGAAVAQGRARLLLPYSVLRFDVPEEEFEKVLEDARQFYWWHLLPEQHIDTALEFLNGPTGGSGGSSGGGGQQQHRRCFSAAQRKRLKIDYHICSAKKRGVPLERINNIDWENEVDSD